MCCVKHDLELHSRRHCIAHAAYCSVLQLCCSGVALYLTPHLAASPGACALPIFHTCISLAHASLSHMHLSHVCIFRTYVSFPRLFLTHIYTTFTLPLSHTCLSLSHTCIQQQVHRVQARASLHSSIILYTQLSPVSLIDDCFHYV